MKKVGVIGAGTMGKGVAEAFASKGYNVILIDCNEEVINKAQKDIYCITRFKNIKIKDDNAFTPDQVIDNITFTTDMNLLKNVDYVIENVVEIYEVKAEIYNQIDLICKENVIFAANTSCISITKLSKLTKRADKIIGIHFMNPVSYIDAVEVIKGYHTSDETIEKTKNLLDTINKESIIIEDFPGFVSNRISHLMMNEAAFIVQDNVAQPKDVDDIFKKCYGHKMGPLETADLIGLDTVVDSLDILYESYKDTKFRCCPLLRKMVDAGFKGIKSSKGFYKY